MSLAIKEVSEIRMTSAESFDLLFSKKEERLAEPTSSSPSIINFTLQGNSLQANIASKALMCI